MSLNTQLMTREQLLEAVAILKELTEKIRYAERLRIREVFKGYLVEHVVKKSRDPAVQLKKVHLFLG